MLHDLKAAKIVFRRRVGRAPKEGGQTLHMADIILLCMGTETPHHHVVLHPLTQRADRSGVDRDSHGKFLFAEGTSNLRGNLAPLKAYIYRITVPHATLPRSGFVHGSECAAKRLRRQLLHIGEGFSRVLLQLTPPHLA